MEQRQPTQMLYRVAGALLILLALTVGLSFADLGAFNFLAAILIGVAKALLVALFFMELRFGSVASKIIAAAGIVWFLLLIGGTLADMSTRTPVIAPF